MYFNSQGRRAHIGNISANISCKSLSSNSVRNESWKIEDGQCEAVFQRGSCIVHLNNTVFDHCMERHTHIFLLMTETEHTTDVRSMMLSMVSWGEICNSLTTTGADYGKRMRLKDNTDKNESILHVINGLLVWRCSLWHFIYLSSCSKKFQALSFTLSHSNKLYKNDYTKGESVTCPGVNRRPTPP